MISAVPYRTDGVDHIPARQAVRSGDLGAAGTAAAECAALLRKLRTCRSVDAAVHTSAAEQRLVGCVYDGIHGHFCYIVANYLKRHCITPKTALRHPDWRARRK